MLKFLSSFWLFLWTTSCLGQVLPPTTGERFADAAPIAVDLTLATQEDLAIRPSGSAAARRLVAEPRSTQAPGSWYVRRLGDQLARVEWNTDRRVYGLRTSQPGQPLALGSVAGTTEELWRFLPFPGVPNNYCLESIAYPGHCATFVGGVLALQPIAFLPQQQFLLAPPILPPPPPRIQSSSRQIIPNAPLPPSNVQLVNSSDANVLVVLGDLSNPANSQEFQITPRGRIAVTLDRDAGATIVETYAILLPDGTVSQQTQNYPVPPVALYDVSVYEIFLQSIAIDRTGKSPHPIEDVNYRPKSVGYFPVPPGAQLPQAASLDVVAVAARANNPGGVRPLPSALPQTIVGGPNPLEAILQEIQSRQSSF